MLGFPFSDFRTQFTFGGHIDFDVGLHSNVGLLSFVCFLFSSLHFSVFFFFFPRCDNRPSEGSSQILVTLAYSCISCSNSFKPILLTFRFLFCVLFFPSVRRNPAKVVEKKNRVAQQNHYGN